LGLVLEGATGQEYGDIVQKAVFNKLKRNSFQGDFPNKNHLLIADGYSKKFYEGDRRAFKHVPARALAASTGLCGTASDLSLIMTEMLFGDKLLTRQQRKYLFETKWPVKNSDVEAYGLGLIFTSDGKRNFVGHSGGWPGFMSQTRHLQKTDYTVSFIMNASEDFGYSIVKSMMSVLTLVANTFPENEIKNVCVSPVMMNWWGGAIYVLGEKRAVYLGVGDWNFASNPTILEKRKDGAYYSEKMSGASSVGEPVRFLKKGKKIDAVKFGAFTATPFEEFQRGSMRNFLQK
jgi:hypothetical protein